MNPPDSDDFLLAQICHLHYARVHQLLEALGLYRGQPPVLRALWEQEGLTHSDLAARLNIAPATVTKMLQRMEKAGFLQRRPDPADQRISRVFLTEAGRAVQTRLQEVFDRMEAETFAGFAPPERTLLRAYLTRMRDNLRAVVDERPQPAPTPLETPSA